MNVDKDMENSSIKERAAEWLIRLDTATAEENAEFLAWLKQSPQHLNEVLITKACLVQLQLLIRGQHIDPNEYIRAAEAAENVRDLGNRDAFGRGNLPRANARPTRMPTAQPHAKRLRWTAAAAAALVGALVAWANMLLPSANRTVATDAGEWRTVTIEDGSIVRAGPRTKLHVQISDERRLIRLTAGEAMFDVEKDPDRPFLVETKVATVRAVGTEFAVRVDGSNRARVDVKEGIVDVARRVERSAERAGGSPESVRLQAGEEVVVTPDDPLVARPADLESALAWVNRELIFNQQTVQEAVQEFNRRNELQMEVRDPKLQQRNIQGIFEATDPHAFAEHLKGHGVIAVMDEKSGILVLSRGGKAAEAND